MKLETIRVKEAVGKVLSHDITRIVKGEFKGPAFRKGHIVTEGDIPELLRMGKENLYIMTLDPGELHEDQAGIRLGTAVAGDGITWRGPKESRVNLYAGCDGLLKVNVPALEVINEIPNVILGTLPNNSVVKTGDLLAGTKVIPLVVPESTVAGAEEIARDAGWVLRVISFRRYQVGVIITGSEVYQGRIKDGFGTVLRDKVESYGSTLLATEYAPDDAAVIADQIKRLTAEGAGLILVTGGMSVDPDDVTPTGIKLSGAVVEKYGAPTFPGAMFLLSYLGEIPILGVPACGMYFKTTILDLILPRLLAGERVTRKDIVALAHGGLCRGCSECRFPNCTFGKGTN